jgi:hypothetical protein
LTGMVVLKWLNLPINITPKSCPIATISNKEVRGVRVAVGVFVCSAPDLFLPFHSCLCCAPPQSRKFLQITKQQ